MAQSKAAGRFVFTFMFMLSLIGTANAFSFDVGELDAIQPSNIGQKCAIFHHQYQISRSNHDQVQVRWDGDCYGGLASGPGMEIIYFKGRLSAQEIVTMRGGKRNGKSTKLEMGTAGPEGNLLTIETYQDGYMCGDGAQYDMNGKVYVAFEGDCQGGMRQTSNPFDYLMQYVGGPSWQMKLIYKFMFDADFGDANNASTCAGVFNRFGFSVSVAQDWCTIYWPR